jgi:hypothetical protein
MGMKTPISILSPCVISAVLHCSNSHATCSECIGIHRFRGFPPVSGQFPPVSDQPASTAPVPTRAVSDA